MKWRVSPSRIRRRIKYALHRWLDHILLLDDELDGEEGDYQVDKAERIRLLASLSDTEMAVATPTRALCMAVEEGDADAVRCALDEGIDPNVRDSDGWTPIFWASFKGDPTDHNPAQVGVAELLINRGASTDVRARDGTTPLHVAAQFGRVELAGLLITSGASVNARTDAGLAALHIAAALGHEETVRILLTHGADVRARSGEGLTAMQFARQGEHSSVVAALGSRGAIA